MVSELACDPTKSRPEYAVPCRYAGRGYEKEDDIERGGTLLVKGLKSMWRQAAPIVRNTLQGALRRIIMQVRPCSMHRFPTVPCEIMACRKTHVLCVAPRCLLDKFGMARLVCSLEHDMGQE